MPNCAAASGLEAMPQSIGIQAGGCDADADLARTGVRLRNLSQLQYLGTSERLVDDGAAHVRTSSRTGDGTWSHHHTR